MPEQLNNFPITPYLSQICAALKDSKSRAIVLTAETGAGKSTILPLDLLKNFQGKILMTEPRRLAVLGVASRVAELNGEECGQTVGYKIHLENKISAQTRLEVVTEAILIKNLQSDPALEGYNVVVIDEFHERSVNTDLALAFLKEAMMLRDDLFVVIMSATIEADKIANYLGDNVPVISIPGRLYPVEVSYDDKHSAAQVAVNCSRNEEGDVLVFLPGIRDIRKCERELKEDYNAEDEAEICILHSSISLSEQKKIIRPDSSRTKKRIILSSAIAETSLTVPGIGTVIDSGLSRINRMDLNNGMGKLVTETETEFSAEQRKGRAGRERAGKCVRLWNEFDVRKKELQPEILRTDLAELVLECADRGVYEVDGIDWFTPPGAAAWNGSRNLLKLLGLLQHDNHISRKGKSALTLGLHPRLASIALEGLVNECSSDSLLIKYSSYNGASPEIQKKFISDIHQRLNKIKLEDIAESCTKLPHDSLLILCGFPDRLAKRISLPGEKVPEFQFYSGRKAKLADCCRLNNSTEWIVAPEVQAGSSMATVFEFEELNFQNLQFWLKTRTENHEICRFEDGKVAKFENLCFGEIILNSRKIPASFEDLASAWVNEVKIKGIECLPLNKKSESLLTRACFFHQQKQSDNDLDKADGKSWESPQNSLELELVKKVNEWLPPFINGSKLTDEMVYNALYWFLNGAELDKEVPEQLVLANGRKCRVTYELQSSPEDKNRLILRPVIEIIIQRIFGCFETPEVCGIKVLLKLLSPASRPLQITDDLEGFWQGAWIEICKEMKGRYTKHNWDYRQCDSEN